MSEMPGANPGKLCGTCVNLQELGDETMLCLELSAKHRIIYLKPEDTRAETCPHFLDVNEAGAEQDAEAVEEELAEEASEEDVDEEAAEQAPIEPEIAPKVAPTPATMEATPQPEQKPEEKGDQEDPFG